MNIVVVGAGLAAAKAVEGLRDRGYDGDITLFGAEPHLPYERPPLSKGLLLGSDEPDSVFVHDQAWYDEQRRRRAHRCGGHRPRPRPTPGRRRGHRDGLRQPAADHRFRTSPARAGRHQRRAGGLPAHPRRLPGAQGAPRPAPGADRRRLDRARGGLGGPQRRRRGHRRGVARAAAPRRSRSRAWRPPSRRCTASTVSTCGWARPSRRSSPTATAPRSASPTAAR